MTAIYVKDKDKTLHQKLNDIKDALLNERPSDMSLKELQKLDSKYHITTVVTYLINKEYSRIEQQG